MQAKQHLLRRAAVLVATVATALGIAAAPAAAAPSTPGSVYEDANGWCHYRNWGGTFHCSTQLYWGKPDGWPQVFVIGREGAVFTRWANAENTYDWLSMGGTCNPNYALSGSSSGWRVVVNCVAVNPANTWWHRERYVDGHWDSVWIRGYKTV